MKKFFYSLCLMLPLCVIAQVAISFEADENYLLGNINQQNDWRTFNMPENEIEYQSLEGQEVTTAFSSEGERALMITSLETFPDDYDGFFGVIKELDSSLSTENGAQITFDVYIDNQDQSDYVVFFADDTIMNENNLIPGIEFVYDGEVYVPMIIDGEMEYGEIDYMWMPNTWMHIEILIQNGLVNYYINDALIHSMTGQFSPSFNGIYIMTDNYGGHMYFDNLNLNVENLSTADPTQNAPCVQVVTSSDYFEIIGLDASEVEKIMVYNTQGKMVEVNYNSTKVNTMNFSKGVYFIQLKKKSGELVKLKFIK